MTTVLVSVFAATVLAAAGVGASADIRSQDAVPKEGLVAAQANPAAAGTSHAVRRLADAPGPDWDNSNHGLCDEHHWHWSAKEVRCHKAANYLPLYVLGAAAAGGLIYAVQSHDSSPSSEPAISH